MKPGDLVKIVKVYRWGGTTETGRHGILVSRTYMGYEEKFSRWLVLLGGEVTEMRQNRLRAIKRQA